jgi:hypothetical protein
MQNTEGVSASMALSPHCHFPVPVVLVVPTTSPYHPWSYWSSLSWTCAWSSWCLVRVAVVVSVKVADVQGWVGCIPCRSSRCSPLQEGAWSSGVGSWA